MSSSRFVRKAVLCWCLASGFAPVVFAQAAYQTNGYSEYPIAGALAGDQTRAALGLSSSGGFLVWQDNGLNNSGLQIAGVALDSSFSRVGSVFRVNRGSSGDQERPQVALFPGGGGVFVWQGGPRSFQHIYARFLSPTNSWLSTDVMVNSSTSTYQANAAVAVLSNGNSVVVWNSFNQYSPNSMLDVYAQIFSPTGQKIGGEFLINEFTDYNQRTPSVAALANGGFVVTWVSEQERMVATAGSGLSSTAQVIHPTVDVYARVYGADGTPSGDEFLVNVGTDLCANPRVAAGTDGGYMIVWGQHNASIPAYGWDILARAFGNNGAPGAVVGVNTFLYGDQYAPQVSIIGTDYLVAWTSLGQDGSAEGVYGRFLANDGSPETGELRLNTTTFGRQMYPAVASDNVGRFLAVWSSYSLAPSGFDLEAQACVSTNFVAPVATVTYQAPYDPTAGNPLGDGGSQISATVVSGTNNPLALDYPGTAGSGTAVSFAQAAGPYNGLFYETNGIAVSSSGYFSANATTKGTYTAKVAIGGKTYSMSGRFNSAGLATNTVKRGSLPAITVQLQLDLAGGDQIRGAVTAGNWNAQLTADRQVFTKSSARSAQAGSYTFVIPSDETSAGSPIGDGVGTVQVDALGNVAWNGSLADGSKVSQKSAVSKDGIWPLYGSLYGGGGSVIAWVAFTNQPYSSMGGQLVWTKAGGVASKYYASGFTNVVWATGSTYTPPHSGQRVLDLNQGDGSLIFYGGGLAGPFTNALSLDLKNHVSVPAGTKLSLSFTPSTGTFRGTTINPATGKSFSFQGILFEQQNLGVGYFLGPTGYGGFYLSPAP